MTQHDNETNKKTNVMEYVTVAIAEDMDLANEYRDILAKHDIPAVTATQKSYASSIIGIAVMVPESYQTHATEIIESQQAFDSFINDAFNDGYRIEPTDDYESDIDNDFK